MLQVDDVHVTYGGTVRALKGVSLQVPEGSVVALLGGNGAGKSTLLRAISGTLRLHRGAVVHGSIGWQGRPLPADAARIVRNGIVQVPEGRRIFGRLTVEENLRAGGLACRDRSQKAAARARVEELFPALARLSGQRAGLLSGGEQQMLAIGRALMNTPRLLLLDEPSLGLAPRIIEQIAAVIAEIQAQGTSILLVEQNAAVALDLADTAHVLDIGQVSLSGPAAELAADDRVRRLYLGDRPDGTAGGTRGGPDRGGRDGRDGMQSTRSPRRTLTRWTG